MAGSQLSNSHQRHKFLRDQGSRNILKFRISKMAFSGVFKRYFPLRMPCFFVKILRNTGNNAIEMSHAIHNIARFKRSTYLNLFKYEVSVFQNWETDALQFYLMVFIFC